jgi:hypothetical protein
MAIEADAEHGKPAAPQERPFAHLRATPEERARLVAAMPFDSDLWQRNAVPPTNEELADLEDFLQEREEMRRHSLERARERLAEPSK